MDKYIILVNGGVYYDDGGKRSVFSREEVEREIKEWSESKVLIDEDGEEVSIDNLVEAGDCGERINVVNEEMVAMSDVGGWVEVSIMKLYM